MHSYGVDDVLHRPLTEVVAIKRKLILDLLVNAAGDADAVRLCQPLQARRNIHAVADQVITLDHHVAEVDADAEMHSLVFGEGGSQSLNGLLDLHRGPNRFYRAWELGNDAVPGSAEYPALVFPDEPIDLLAAGLKDPIGPLLIGAHHARIAHAISVEYGRKLACWPALFHRTLQHHSAILSNRSRD